MKKKKPVRNLAGLRKRNLRLRVTDVNDKNFPETKSFECRFRLTYNSEFYECLGDLVQRGEGHLNEGLELAKRIFEVDGVQELEINGYRVYVTISQAFDWEMDDLLESVRKKIIAYISKKFSADEIIDQVNEKFKPKQ